MYQQLNAFCSSNCWSSAFDVYTVQLSSTLHLFAQLPNLYGAYNMVRFVPLLVALVTLGAAAGADVPSSKGESKTSCLNISRERGGWCSRYLCMAVVVWQYARVSLTMLVQSMSCTHPQGIHFLHQAQSALRCSSCRIKGNPHSTKNGLQGELA